jgi:hypothetical protein
MYCQWVDACHKDGPLEPEEALDHAGILMHTAGFLIAEDDNFVCLSMDYCEASHNCRVIYSIPKSQIVHEHRIPLEPYLDDEELEEEVA